MSIFDRRDGRGSHIDFHRIATVLAVLFPLVGIAGVVGPYLLGLTNLALLATYIAVPSLLAPLLYLYISNADTVQATVNATAEADVTARGRNVNKLLMAGYFVLLAASVVLLVSSEVRPYSYYVVIAGLAVVVLAQVLRFSPDTRRAWPLLAQIVLLQLNLVWGVTLKYNYFIGRTDILGHVQLVHLLLENDAILARSSGFYQSFPLWHVLGAMEHVLFGGQVAPRTTLFVLSGLLYALVPIGVYLVATRLFDSPRVALTAGLLTCLDSTVIHNGMYAIPRSVAAFLFVFALFTWVWDDERSVVLFAVFALAIAAYHTVSLPFVFVILSVLYFFQRIAVPWISDGVEARTVGTSYMVLALVVVIQAAYWLFFAEFLLEHIISVAFQKSPQGQINSSVVEQPLRELANYLHHATLLVFVFAGTLLGLASDRISGAAKATLFTTLIVAGISLPGPHLLIDKLAESFNILRFAQYTFPFVSMTAAYGIVMVLRRADTPRSRISADTIKVVALAVFVLFSVTTVSNDFIASDNPLVERQFYTNYISEAEEESLRTAAAISAGAVASDYVGTRYYDASRYAAKARILGVDRDAEQLYLGSRDDLVVVREKELQRRPLQVWATDDYQSGGGYLAELRYVDGDASVWSDLTTANRMYDSGVLSAYQRSAVMSSNRTRDGTASPS